LSKLLVLVQVGTLGHIAALVEPLKGVVAR
jgi:hypothetical protein